MNTQDITLDLSKEYVDSTVIRIGMGDMSGTTIRATILDNALVPSLDGMSATFHMRLPDDEHYVRDGNCTVSGNVVTYVVDESHCCSVAGYTDDAYFELSSETNTYSTSRFRVKVVRAVYNDAEPAESWDNAINALIARGNAKMAEYEEAEQGRNNAVITGADATIDTTKGTPSIDVTLDTPSALGRIIHFAFNHLTVSADNLDSVTNAQIDTIVNDGSVESTNVLQATGLTYLWSKIKAKFASLVGGVVPVSQGGTGKNSHTSNAVLTGSGTSAVKNVETANGAFYATSSGGAATFDTLPVAQGGTGLEASPSMLTNLGSTSAADVMQATPRPGVTGILPVTNGGMGKTSHMSNAVITGNGTGMVNNIATKSGAFYATAANGAPDFDTLPIAQGGTGATSAANAVVNIVDGQHIKPQKITATSDIGTTSGDVYTRNGDLKIQNASGTDLHKLSEKANSAALATVESATAKANHAVGDMFMLDGNLRRATQAIAANTAISNSNSETVTIDDTKVSKAGDIMSGNLRFQNNNISTATPPSTQQATPIMQFGGPVSTIGLMWAIQRASGYVDTYTGVSSGGRVDMCFGVFNPNNTPRGVRDTALLRMQLMPNGTVSYYVDDPSAFRNAINASASTSDARLKSNIKPLGSDAEVFIDALKPCSYIINGKRQVGLLAQDVSESDQWDTDMTYETYEGLDDWERMEDGTPTWQLDYTRIIAPLVATVQSQQRRIEELENAVRRLQEQRPDGLDDKEDK